MIFIGVILLIVAVICFFIYRSESSKLRAMSATDTYTAQLLKDLHTRVVGTLGSDALAQACEVEGIIECSTPLTGPISKKPSVAYTYQVTREYEEEVTSRDSDGKTTRKTERGSETITSEDRRTNFWVRDATGQILVNPEGADLDLIEMANRFEDEPAQTMARRRTLGKRMTERALPVGTKVYILGFAVDHEGQPMITRDPRGKGLFIVSRKSERELMQSAESWSRNLRYVTIGSGVLGVLLVIIDLLT